VFFRVQKQSFSFLSACAFRLQVNRIGVRINHAVRRTTTQSRWLETTVMNAL